MISINSATVFILLCFTMSFLRSADLQESTRPELLIDIKVGSSVVVHEILSDHVFKGNYRTLDIRRRIINLKDIDQYVDEDIFRGIPWIQSISVGKSHGVYYIQKTDLGDEFMRYKVICTEPGDYLLLTTYGFDDQRYIYYGCGIFTIK